MRPWPQVAKSVAIVLIALIMAGCSPLPSTPDDLPGTLPGSPPPASTLLSSSPTRIPPTATLHPPTATAPEPFTLAEAKEILGTWKYSESDFTRFYEDGTVHDAYSLAQLDADPFAINRFEVEAGRLTMHELSVSGVPPCGSKVGVYEIRLLQSGNLQIVTLRDECRPRAGDVEGIYERVP
jgi:hypothetical protein